MINFSEKYKLNVESGNPNKVYYIHVFYSGSSFIPISNKTIFVDGREYYDCLTNTYGSNLKWNILDDNKVTTSTPTIEMNNFIFENGVSFLDFIYSNGHFIGNKCQIFLSYDGLSNADALQLGEYTIQEININNKNSIEISLNTEQLYDTYINGRKINSVKQTIGTGSLPSTYKVQDDANGITLPINFGNSKNHVLTQYCYKETENTEYAGVYEKGDLYYSYHDKEWWNKLKSNPGMVGQFQYNFNKNSQLITVPDNNMMVTIPEVDWHDYTKLTWEMDVFDEFGGSSIIFYSGSNSIGNDNSLFIVSPLRYVYNTGSYKVRNLPPEGTITSSLGDVSTILSNRGDFTFLIKIDSDTQIEYDTYSDIYLTADLSLDLNYNLRTNKYGVVNRKLKHSVVDASDSIILGQFYGNSPEEADEVGVLYTNPGVGTQILLHSFQNNYYPTSIGHRVEFYNKTPFPSKNYLGTTKLFNNYIGSREYNYNTKAFITKYATGSMVFTNWEKLPGSTATPTDEMKSMNADGAAAYNSNIGNLQRDGLDKNIRCLFEAYNRGNDYTRNIQYIAWTNLCNVNTSRISDAMSPKTYLGYCGNGAVINSGSILTSAPAHSTDYYMKRNYEYLEAVLRAKSPTIEIGDSFSMLPTIFESHFSSSRDYSGTSIYKEIKLSDWTYDLIKSEPFTMYKDSTNKYEIAGMNKQYTSGSYTYAEIDYNDSTIFNMFYGDSKKVFTEVTTTTGFVPQIDKYEYKLHYKINPAQYDYSYWRLNNTYDNNSLIAPDIEKSTTGQIEESVSRVQYNGVGYGCIKSNVNKTPVPLKVYEYSSGSYWLPIVSGFETYYPVASLPTWNGSSQYYGPEIENYNISKYNLNLMANRKVMINFTTANLAYANLQLGDLVEFRNVPTTLLGNNINGFNGATNYSVSINGQNHYCVFIITSIKKDYKNIQIEAMQLVDLNAYDLIDMEDVVE